MTDEQTPEDVMRELVEHGRELVENAALFGRRLDSGALNDVLALLAALQLGIILRVAPAEFAIQVQPDLQRRN